MLQEQTTLKFNSVWKNCFSLLWEKFTLQTIMIEYLITTLESKIEQNIIPKWKKFYNNIQNLTYFEKVVINLNSSES